MIHLTDTQRKILGADGHVLVKGGPGSGKTTVSILKAGMFARERLQHNQRVLFLSFARATVSRILEAMDQIRELSRDITHKIEVDTYHSFFWRLIKSHGYLLGLPRRINVLAPSAEAIMLSRIRNEYKHANGLNLLERHERLRIAMEDGFICFDLFAEFAARLLHGSNKIRLLVANAYPAIIIDEFQDTADDQWHVIQALGRDSKLLALADPEQRIFDFIGAHPDRLRHFENEFNICKFDLGDENHRSKGTDIAQFGNDILNGTFSKNNYNNVYIKLFESNKNQAIAKLVIQTIKARKRLLKTGETKWSLAVLVPTKRMTRVISGAFREPIANLPKIKHYAAVDLVAAILAAEIIAYALQGQDGSFDVGEFIALVHDYFCGKGGDMPTMTNLKEASRIQKAYKMALVRRQVGREPAKNSLFLPMEVACTELLELRLTGDPDRDWTAVRSHFADCNCIRLKRIATEVRNIRLLDRGTQLREALSQNWRDTGHYANALEIVREAFAQEHFSTNAIPESGVVVMNMHKAKGKQFDEVIIFEGWPRYQNKTITANPDRIVRGNLQTNVDDQARQNLRVSITRAKQRTTLLTPKEDPCVLLTSNDQDRHD